MKTRGRALYRIVKGNYPNHGKTMNWGRFFSWNAADEFLKKKLGWRAPIRHEMFTIMDDNEVPF